MAIYDSLLVSAGGGIIINEQKSDRCNDATICIGLGGTGKDALKKLKKEVYKHLKPDDPDSAVPTYRNIKFLLIDSDDAGLDETHDISSINRSTEYFDISNNNIIKTFRSNISVRRELSWLNHENIMIRDARHGAGAIRQVGRFLLIDKAGLLKAKLTTIIQDAIQGMTGELHVHIFSGISGGTGSGTFIDVCYIVRHVLEILGLDNTQISGYFFLPDVNLSVPEVMGSTLTSNIVRCNGYAALKELDYLMGLEESKDKFVQDYGGFEINTFRSPVDLCYLISTTTSNGLVMPNGYEYGLSVAVDYVISFLSKVTLPDGLRVEEAGAITLKGHIANLAEAKNNIQKVHGASFEYNIIGAANAEMPLSDITTYLGSKLFGRFEGVFSRIPSENDLTDFVMSNQMTFEQLMQQLTKGVTYKVPYPQNLVRSQDITPGDRRVISCADNWTANASGTLEENRRSMTEALQNYDVPENSTSVISRIFSSLYHYSMSSEKGPFFAMNLLGGQNNKNLVHIIDGYIQQNEELLSAETRQEPLRRQEIELAERALGRAHFINRRKCIENYLTAMNLWYVHLAVIDKHNSMRNLLTELREQVVTLNNEFFRVMTIVMDTLKNTFSENSRLLSEGTVSRNAYTWQILTIKDIKGQLDQEVEQMDADQELKKLVEMFFKKWSDWCEQDENKISRLISQYITTEFLTITNKEMTDYLKIKFHAMIPVILENKIKEEIIQNQLSRNADPLFWKNGLFDLSQIAKNSTLSVPFNAAEIINAAEQIKHEGYTVRRTGLTDRIFMMRFYSGIPLYAYQGLADLEKTYEAHITEAGRHLYEAGEVDWREYLPSPYPDSFRMHGHTIPRIVERNQKLTEELNQAKEAGIVYSDTTGWHVKRTNVPDAEPLLAQVNKYETNGHVDIQKLQEVLEKLQNVKETMYDENHLETPIPISTQGAKQGCETVVLNDNYLRYPEIEKIVREQLKKVHDIDQAIERLEKLQSNVQKEQTECLF